MIVIKEAIAKVITEQPKLEKHAKERALERYGMTPDQLQHFISVNMRNMQFVSLSTGYGGRLSRMFVLDDKTFIFALKENRLITTFPCDAKKASAKCAAYMVRLKRKARAIFNDEVRRIDSAEAKALREIELFRAEVELEIGRLRSECVKTRSTAKKIAYKARIAALELRLEDVPSEIATVQVEKNRKLQALTSIIKPEGVAQ